MFFEVLGKAEQRILQSLDQFCQGRLWQLKAALIFSVFAVCAAFPAYDYLVGSSPPENWGIIESQIEAPFSPIQDLDPKSHGAKRAFRLSIPVLGSITGISDVRIFLFIQHILGIAFFLLVMNLVLKVGLDRACAFLVGLTVASIYLGKSFFWDLSGWFDGFAYFSILAAMLVNRDWIRVVFLSFAFWTDERAIFASALVYLWYKWDSRKESSGVFYWILPERSVVSVVVSWILYAGLRLWLGTEFELNTPLGESGAFGLHRWESFVPAIFTTFEVGWLLVALGAVALFYGRNITLLIMSALAFMAVLVPALLVADMTRSLTYAFPILLLCLAILKAVSSVSEMRRLLLVVSLGCVLFPDHVVISKIKWMHPIIPGIFVEHKGSENKEN